MNNGLYIIIITNDKLRNTLTQFTLRSHCLFIETGRYNGTPRNERKCVLCTQNVCESECPRGQILYVY